MSDHEYWLVTVRFPGWVDGDKTFDAYGVRYLVKTGVIACPYDEDDDSEAALFWTPESMVLDEFSEQWKQTIGGAFDGDILFVEPFQVTILSPAPSDVPEQQP